CAASRPTSTRWSDRRPTRRPPTTTTGTDMARQRRNAPDLNPGSAGRPERGTSAGERVRQRLAAQPLLELTEEELRALADEGIDPEEVRRVALERRDQEASDHDRDTPRDDLESLAFETDEDY